MTNVEHLRKWTRELRETDVTQARSNLAVRLYADGPVGMCCLGILSLMAGCEYAEPGHYEQDTGRFGTMGAAGLAPIEAVQWLGLEVPNGTTQSEWDLAIDWPENLTLPPSGLVEGVEPSLLTDTTTTRTAAGLNDSGFTFTQIADIIDYFGIKEQAA